MVENVQKKKVWHNRISHPEVCSRLTAPLLHQINLLSIAAPHHNVHWSYEIIAAKSSGEYQDVHVVGLARWRYDGVPPDRRNPLWHQLYVLALNGR